ncbi:MAG: ATP-binding protein [Bacilli bacterium]|jgi:MinD superfamily P-loop ATPase|nr:ATP-binding protein [Bacilli bacterium]
MKQLLVLSGKGGTGKTTIANALIELFQAKRFADCDVDAPNLHLLKEEMEQKAKRPFYGLKTAKINLDTCINCGLCSEHCAFQAISKKEYYTVDPFSCEGCGLCARICPVQAIQMIEKQAGVLSLYQEKDQLFSTATLRMGSGNSGLLVTEVKKQITDNPHLGMVIIDGAPGIGCPVIASLSGADACLMIAEPTVSGFSDLKRVIATARSFHPLLFVCINKYDINEQLSEDIQTYCLQEGLDFVGRIPFDEEVINQLKKKKGLLCASWKSKRAVIQIYLKIKARMEEYENKNISG